MSFDDIWHEFNRGLRGQVSDNDHETWLNLGVVYREMRALTEAADAFQRAARSEALRFAAAFREGECRFLAGEAQAAVEAFRHALGAPRVSPDERLVATYNLALALEQAGHLAEALASIEAVLAEQPAHDDAAVAAERIRNSLAGGREA